MDQAPGDEHQRSDAELLAAAQAGDVGAFEVLYFRHRDFVYRVARRYGGSDEAALEAAQEVFAYLLRKLPGLRLTGKLSTYLYPVAKNIALTGRRKARGERRKGERVAAGLREEAGARQDREEGESTALMDAVAALPEGQREVLLMRVVDEMSVEEVAAALAVPTGTVKSRLHHALAALREDGRVRGLMDE